MEAEYEAGIRIMALNDYKLNRDNYTSGINKIIKILGLTEFVQMVVSQTSKSEHKGDYIYLKYL